MDERFAEFDLIDLIASKVARLEPSSGGVGRLRTGIGDDAAITVPGGATATSVDAIVEGVHFDRAWSPPDAISHKAVAAALSDLAAMAAAPGEVYVTLGVPPDTDRAWLESLAEGFAIAAERFSVVLAGGDTVTSPVLFASVTVVGHAPQDTGFVLRSGARPGQLVVVTGSLGGAAAGLWLLSNGPGAADGMDEGLAEALIGRQLRPEPQIEAGLLLGAAGAASMVDLSDGLVADLGHVGRASGVAIEIDSTLVPVQPGVPEVIASAGAETAAFVLAGGEDFELAVTVEESAFLAAREGLAAAGIDLTAIGTVASGEGVSVVGPDGPVEVPAGFEHLA